MFSRLYESNTEDISKNLAYKRKDVSFIVDIIIVVDPHVHKYNRTLEMNFLNVCMSFWPYSVKLYSLNVVLFKLTSSCLEVFHAVTLCFMSLHP